MRIKIISDIHSDFMHSTLTPDVYMESSIYDKPDVLVIAGDVHIAGKMSDSLKWFADNYEQVVFVPGNHDSYHGSLTGVEKEVEGINDRYSNVHGLINDCIRIQGQRFIGATMWFREHPENPAHQYRMNDFRLIKDFADEVYGNNAKTLKYFQKEMEPGDVVITHHTPSVKSSHPRYANDPLNRFYVCDATDLISEKKPALWCHGHTHDSYDYMIDETRVICNPVGYLDYDFNYKFNPGLMVEI